eukprot:TRINITY_DN27889_c0_g1_i2.p1 TRINITY_DN27889_c0_g1~~TRINITY_DN27889_c0_g1_i2.p1  ORF type:complete len:161 (+),score=55.84 TRINITY_DN27889_c0_g1_i2:87-569(+)
MANVRRVILNIDEHGWVTIGDDRGRGDRSRWGKRSQDDATWRREANLEKKFDMRGHRQMQQQWCNIEQKVMNLWEAKLELLEEEVTQKLQLKMEKLIEAKMDKYSVVGNFEEQAKTINGVLEKSIERLEPRKDEYAKMNDNLLTQFELLQEKSDEHDEEG